MTSPSNLDVSSNVSWPEKLSNDSEIAVYISGNSSGYVDTRMVEDHFFGCMAKLKLMPISELSEGDTNGNVRSKKKEDSYKKMKKETMPPIVVENGIVEDGNHRFRVARDRGDTNILCYLVEEISLEMAEEQKPKISFRPS